LLFGSSAPPLWKRIVEVWICVSQNRRQKVFNTEALRLFMTAAHS